MKYSPRHAERKRWKKKHRDLHLAQKSRNNKSRKQRAHAFLITYKSKHPCICGENDPAALDFHHIDPEKKNGDMGRLMREGWARLLEEIKGCVVICANCHRKGHAGRPRHEHRKFFRPQPDGLRN